MNLKIFRFPSFIFRSCFLQVFDDKEIADLVETIVTFATLGFGMTTRDIGELVESYVEHNNHRRGLTTFNYRGRKGYPGPDWINSFIASNNLSSKQATTLSTARYNATKNPFLIYGYYDLIADTVKNMGIENKPHLYWNCDESGLPHEPKKLKVVSRKGQKTLLVSSLFNYFYNIFVYSSITHNIQ